MKLRPYQDKAISDLRASLRQYRRVLLTAPTGAGKTALTVHMMKTAAARGKTSMFLVHRKELLEQTSKALWNQSLEHGMIASGKRKSMLPVQVASVQTLVKRLDQYECPDLIIIDECHRSCSPTYQKILEAYPRAVVVGLTASPQRTDGKGLDEVYDNLVLGPSVGELMELGFLCRYELYAPPSVVDMSGVKTKMGDYDRHQTEEAMDKPTITGNAVGHYIALKNNPRCVVFCVSRNHSDHVAAEYNAAGIPAESVHGATPSAVRSAALDRFRDGATRVLCGVDLFVEGLDIPSVEVVQMLRPTQSLIIYLQAIGRGLRPSKGKDKLIILDHVNNSQRHGLPCDEREWSLEGKKRGSRQASDPEDISIKQCQQCWHVFKAGPDCCPKCGAPVQLSPREIEVIEGELQKIEIEKQRQAEKRERGKARTLQELAELGKQRGYKPGWAAQLFARRQGRKPTPQEIQLAREYSDA